MTCDAGRDDQGRRCWCSTVRFCRSRSSLTRLSCRSTTIRSRCVLSAVLVVLAVRAALASSSRVVVGLRGERGEMPTGDQ